MTSSSRLKVIAGSILTLAGVFVCGVWFGQTREQLRKDEDRPQTSLPHERPAARHAGIELLPGSDGHIKLNSDLVNTLKVKVASVRPAPLTEPLVLTGSLFLDSNHLAVVHTRFAGELVEVGQVPERDEHGVPVVNNGRNVMRQLRAGDDVTKGQLIAVVWSKEIGETKSDLVEALSRRNTTKATLERLQSLQKGSVPEQVILDAQQKYQSDVIAVERAERTLRSWRETDDEIAEVYAESARIVRGESSTDSRVRQTWANVEIRAPLSGTIMERNGTVGEIINTGIDIFTIADLSRMGVLANVYEEDIHKLTALTPDQRSWKVSLKAEPESPPIEGRFEVIGHVVDPSVHTAAVVGWIENPNRRLRTNQFITATIELPGPTDAVAVPNSAIIDEGDSATVFVASDAALHDVQIRNVSIIKRGRDLALIQRLPEKQSKVAPLQPLEEGELVITSGNLELFGFLKDQPTTIGSR